MAIDDPGVALLQRLARNAREATVPTVDDVTAGASGWPLGATAGEAGTRFRVWAPSALEVFVVGGSALDDIEMPGFVPVPSCAMAALGDGTWAAFRRDVHAGDPYRFWVKGRGSLGPKRDPRARELTIFPAYPRCNCIVRAANAYPWQDQEFQPPAFRDQIHYQLHVGTYYAVDASGNDTRRAVARFLDLLYRLEYLRELGVNVVQLMPVQEFPSPTSQGYNGLDLYSPEMDYQVHDTAELARHVGKANQLFARFGKRPIAAADIASGTSQLKCVVDLFHAAGIAVLFDIVLNHAGPGFDDQGLWFLDRDLDGDPNRSLYFTDAGWVGGKVFAYWKQEVRAFLIDNAKQCIEEYHVDGLRYDEVTVIDRHGGGRFCQDVTSTLRFMKPQAIQVAEYWADDRAAALRPAPAGLGFDAQWGDRLRDGIRDALRQMSRGMDASVDVGALAAALEAPSSFGEPWRTVNCLENHDIVQEGRDPRVARLADPHDARSWYARSRARLAAGLLLTARGIPLLFMGQEFLEDKAWSDDVAWHAQSLIWWDGIAQSKPMADYLRFMGDLVWLRRTRPALRGDSLRITRRDGFERVLCMHRWLEGVGADVLVAASLQEIPRHGMRVGFPGEGAWREVFNSDYYDDCPNARVVGNAGFVYATRVPWDGFDASAAIDLPANGFIVFARSAH